MLSWLWALGTAIGFVCLAASVDGELGNRDASSHPAFTTPEAAEFAAV